ncbi:MAG TPA: DNA repair protein RadA [Conexibacter sp.]|jgi:DNA repair protein RadA/Sms|nr:DNA repair protein RadA [Conexibacter sp.]
MARATSVHVCSDCGHETPRWHGRCPGCGAWNTLVEEAVARPAAASGRRGALGGGAAAKAAAPIPLAHVEAADVARLSTGIGELDRVLGGGVVPGSLVLIGGSPGIGKSTLTTMVLANLVGSGRRTLYVSAEESAAQIKLRAERLGCGHGPGRPALQIPVIAETDLAVVLATLERERPDVCVVDSVQTLHAAALSGAPGSVGQVREVAGEIMRVAKVHGIAVLLVGHVTKEGSLAGPRVLEHLVDCVLQFEGERERTYRTLRSLKNRFGSTSEAGVFEMRDDGLVEVLDASARFVGEATRAPGSVVLAAMEGSRPLLVEVQALVSQSDLEVPRRVVSGIDRNRLALVLAVLARHGGVGVGTSDVFVNVVGGVRVDEPGADLAVALAVASAARGVALTGSRGSPSDPGEAPPLACFGELGLTGELRTVAHAERRVAEARKFGLATIVTPEVGTLRAALRTLRASERSQGATRSVAAV